MKRILFIVDADGVGGVEKRFSHLFKFLSSKAQLNEQVVFFVNKKLSKKIDSYKSKLKNNEIKIMFFGTLFKGKSVFKIIPRLIEGFGVLLLAIKFGLKFDAIVFVTTRSLKYRFLINSKNKIIVAYAATLLETGIIYKIYKKISRRGFIFDCLSHNIAEQVKKINGITLSKVFTSPNSFIDFEGTDVDYKEKEDIVSFAARFDFNKGIDLLLDAIDYVLGRGYKIKFIILGYGSLKRKIEDFIILKKYSGQVSVLYVNNPKEYLKKSKVFLSLQNAENYPSQSLIEAMACKNAIIATDVGLTYKLVDCHTGKRVKKDPVEIAKAIIDLIENEDKLSTLGNNAREFVLHTHTVENYYKYLSGIALE